jgi:hypothetical protein
MSITTQMVNSAIPGVKPDITKPLLGHCQGDCDNDRDCAEGLVYFNAIRTILSPGASVESMRIAGLIIVYMRRKPLRRLLIRRKLRQTRQQTSLQDSHQTVLNEVHLLHRVRCSPSSFPSEALSHSSAPSQLPSLRPSTRAPRH